MLLIINKMSHDMNIQKHLDVTLVTKIVHPVKQLGIPYSSFFKRMKSSLGKTKTEKTINCKYPLFSNYTNSIPFDFHLITQSYQHHNK